ncbi:hypothetical protein O181_008832 [Austropuccinia psidii MF-1]|uniref:Uncharacterized protein n=1 Tax=Austropuccinia psidii MF-1 TaxID=1389203 RepID=A0A9Q3BPK4_9BASI|nr:hypothetical protein [Austropuccinia psidii MF-1]
MLRLQIAFQENRGNLNKHSGGLSRWALANTPDNPAYAPLESDTYISINRIDIADIGTEFFEEVRDSYNKNNNFHILTSLLDKDCKDTALVN